MKEWIIMMSLTIIAILLLLFTDTFIKWEEKIKVIMKIKRKKGISNKRFARIVWEAFKETWFTDTTREILEESCAGIGLFFILLSITLFFSVI